MKVAVISDTHFGARNDNASFAEYFRLFYENVFFPTLEEENIDTIIHLGDLNDRRKYINFVTAKNLDEQFMKPIRDRDMSLHVILGNHDTYYRNTNDINGIRQLYGNSYYQAYHIYENDPVELDLDGCHVMLCPWISPSNKDRAMRAIENTKAQILMGHFEIQGFEMMKGQLCDHGLNKDIFKKFDAVYSGHFHHPSSHSNITYLGAPYEMNWSDYEGKRGFHIFDSETREMRFIPNPYQMFHKIVYDDQDMTIEDVSRLDISMLTNTHLKVIVKNKSNPYIFDLFLDRLQQSGATDIKVVEDHMNLDVIDEEELLDEAQDTLSILRQYVSNLEIQGDKNKVEKVLRELYTEAMNT
jgi:DNA repair exonuclease SbcCD nuclease subunit